MHSTLPPISTALPSLTKRTVGGDPSPSARMPQMTAFPVAVTAPPPAVADSTSSNSEIEMHRVVAIIKHREIDKLSLWIRETRDLNIRDFAGNTPLHWACNRGATDMVGLLLRRGAEAKVENTNGATPLHCAAFSGVKEICDMLLQSGCDPCARNRQGKTFFDICRSKGYQHLEFVYHPLEASLRDRLQQTQRRASDGAKLGVDSEEEDDDASSTSTVGTPVMNYEWMPRGRAPPQPMPEPHVGDKKKRKVLGGKRKPRKNSSTSPPAAPLRRMTLDSSSLSADVYSSSPDEVEVVYVSKKSGERRYSQPPPQPAAGKSTSSTERTLAERRELERRLRLLDVSQASSLQMGGYHTDTDHSGNRTVPINANSPDSFSTKSTAPAVLESSQSRYLNPDGRILCSACNPDSRNAATSYCEDCRRVGEACWLCDGCWTNEHSSRKTRDHRRGPVPIPQSNDKYGAFQNDLPFQLGNLSLEARAYFMMQQQIIRNLTVPNVSQQALKVDHSVQTMETIQGPHFAEAMSELKDVKEQLEAEVYHSQTLIDSTRLQLLEALELRFRAEVESQYYRRLISIKRPPEIVVVVQPFTVPEAYAALPRQKAGSGVVTPQPVAVDSAVAVKRRKNATDSRGVQCNPIIVHAYVQTVMEEQLPPKTDKDGVQPRYAANAVEVVHGEKHLPEQPQMLLVQWRGSQEESWVPAYEVAHCTAVVAYLSRYDKSWGPSIYDALDSPLQGMRSPLNESERTELSRQLAAIQRVATGTANGSRDGQLLDVAQQHRKSSSQVTFLPRPGSMLPAGFQPIQELAASDDLALTPEAATDEEPAPPTPSAKEDLLLIQQYETRLRELEAKQKDLREARDAQEARVTDLRAQQRAESDRKRAAAHQAFEARARNQPEVQDPLQATNERHAALALRELQQEVNDEETHRITEAIARERAAMAAAAASTSAPIPPPPPPPAPLAAVLSQQKPPPLSSIAASSQRPISPQRESNPFDQKMNRIFYEQYFMSKAQAKK